VSDSLLTVADVAKRLSVPVSWVYAKVESGALAHLKIGRYVRFEAQAIEAYLERQRQAVRT
jgi:excisionase family DNA binding protein